MCLDEEDSSLLIFIAIGIVGVLVIIATVIICYVCYRLKCKRPSLSRETTRIHPLGDAKDGLHANGGITQLDLEAIEEKIRSGKIKLKRHLAPLSRRGNAAGGGFEEDDWDDSDWDDDDIYVDSDGVYHSRSGDDIYVDSNGVYHSRSGAGGGRKGKRGRRRRRRGGGGGGDGGIDGIDGDGDTGEYRVINGVKYDADGLEVIEDNLFEGDRLPSASDKKKPAHHLPPLQAVKFEKPKSSTKPKDFLTNKDKKNKKGGKGGKAGPGK